MIPLLRFSGVQCKRALHYTSLFKERQIKQTYPAWTRGLRPRGVGDADAQGAMRQLRGVGPRCRPKGCVAYACALCDQNQAAGLATAVGVCAFAQVRLLARGKGQSNGWCLKAQGGPKPPH